MEKIFEGKYQYKGYTFHKFLSECYLEIYQDEDGSCVVIATELQDNPGTSVTNAAGAIATQVVSEFGINPEKLTWIEHYPDRDYGGRKTIPEDFDLVTFTRSGNELRYPKWKRVGKEEVERLIARDEGSQRMVVIKKDDGSSEIISGEDLELDVEEIDGEERLVIRGKNIKENSETLPFFWHFVV